MRSAYRLGLPFEPSLQRSTTFQRGEMRIWQFPFIIGYHDSSQQTRHPSRTRMTL